MPGPVDEKFESDETMPYPVFDPNPFAILNRLLAEATIPRESNTCLKASAWGVGALNGYAYNGTGMRASRELWKIGLIDREKIAIILGRLLDAGVTFSNVAQAAQFTIEAILPILPWVSVKGNESKFAAYYREKHPWITAITYVCLALLFQSSIAYLIYQVNKSLTKALFALIFEAPLMLAAIPTVKKLIQKLCRAMNLCHTTDDTIDLLLWHKEQPLKARVSEAQLYATQQATIDDALEILVSQIEKATTTLIQAALKHKEESTLRLRKALEHMQDIAQKIKQGEIGDIATTSEIPELIKLILQNAESPLQSLSSPIKLTLVREILSDEEKISTERPDYGALILTDREQQNPLAAPLYTALLRFPKTDTGIGQKIASFLSAAPLASAFIMNVAASAPKLHPALTAILAVSALVVAGLILNVNNDRVHAIVKAFRAIHKDGLLEWYHQSIRPATWSRTSLNQVIHLPIFLLVLILVSQSYSSILAGLIEACLLLGMEERSENLKLLAGILWGSTVTGNLIYNLYFLKIIMEMVENFINRGQDFMEGLFTRFMGLFTDDASAPQPDIEEISTMSDTPISRQEIHAFNRISNEIRTTLLTPSNPSLMGVFKTEKRPDMTCKFFLLLFDALILKAKPEEREASAWRCFGKSLAELEKDVVTTIQLLIYNQKLDSDNAQRLDSDLETGLMKFVPLLEKCGTAICDTADGLRLTNHSLPNFDIDPSSIQPRLHSASSPSSPSSLFAMPLQRSSEDDLENSRENSRENSWWGALWSKKELPASALIPGADDDSSLNGESPLLGPKKRGYCCGIGCGIM